MTLGEGAILRPDPPGQNHRQHPGWQGRGASHPLIPPYPILTDPIQPVRRMAIARETPGHAPDEPSSVISR